MTEIVRIERLELAFAPRPWPFARGRAAAEIAAHFDRAAGGQSPRCGTAGSCCCTITPSRGDVFRGAYLETDYASFVAWRDWGFPDAGGEELLLAWVRCARADGAFLLGVMGPHTAQCRQGLFSGRHARPRRHRRRHGRPRPQRPPRDGRRRPGSVPTTTGPTTTGIACAPRRGSRMIKVLHTRASRRARCASASSRISRASRAGARRHPDRARSRRSRIR